MMSRDKKTIYILLFLHFTAISIFRIDFSAGRSEFNYSPYILSSLLLISYFFYSIIFSKKLNLYLNRSIIILFIFVFYTGFILIFSLEELYQFRRWILLCFHILASYAAIVILMRLNFSEQKNMFYHSFLAVFLIYLFFSYYQIKYFNDEIYRFEGYSTGIINLYPVTIGSLVPRLSGSFIDSNIASLYLITCFYISLYYRMKNYIRIIIIFLILLTLSRSGMLAFFSSFCIYLILSRYKFNTRKILKYMFYTVGVAFLFYFIVYQVGLDKIIPNWTELKYARFSFSSRVGSTKTHLDLIEFGLDLIQKSFLFFIFGHGFGFSTSLTQGFFQGNDHANFHSEYITILIETGVIGAILYSLVFIIMILKSFQIKNRNKSLVISLIVFIGFANIFYQQYLFSYYWFIIFFTSIIIFNNKEPKLTHQKAK